METEVTLQDGKVVVSFTFEDGKRDSFIMGETSARNFKAQLEAALKTLKEGLK